MGITDRYRTAADLPASIPVFPLQGCILLPRSSLPLNVFEPRYLSMVDDVIAGDRIVGIVQPLGEPGGIAAVQGAPAPADGLRGAAFRILGNRGRAAADHAHRHLPLRHRGRVPGPRSPTGFATPITAPFSRISCAATARMRWIGRASCISSRPISTPETSSADWDSIQRSPTELLINTLSMISPYGPEEKQALLEAPDLKTRAEILMALAEMEIAAPDAGPGSSLH